jgi:hypothetical protein
MTRHYRTFMPAPAVFARALAILVLAVPHTWAAAQSDDDAQARTESVMAFRATGQQLVFRVPTGGCTTVADFHVDVQRSGREARVSLTRQRRDSCKGWFPEGVEISFAYGDVGLQRADRVQLVNNSVPPAQPPQ